MQLTVAEPDLELTRGVGGGFDLRALLAFLPCVVSSFFTQNKGPPGPSRRSISGKILYTYCFKPCLRIGKENE